MFVYDKWHKQTVVDIILSFSFPNILKKTLLSHDMRRLQLSLMLSVLVRFFPYIKVIYG